jgi:hypothetical protein
VAAADAGALTMYHGLGSMPLQNWQQHPARPGDKYELVYVGNGGGALDQRTLDEFRTVLLRRPVSVLSIERAGSITLRVQVLTLQQNSLLRILGEYLRAGASEFRLSAAKQLSAATAEQTAAASKAREKEIRTDDRIVSTSTGIQRVGDEVMQTLNAAGTGVKGVADLAQAVTKNLPLLLVAGGGLYLYVHRKTLLRRR